MKKAIIIIAILALVGFCVYWFGFRKKDEGSVVTGGDGSGTDSPLNGGVLTDKTSTDSIVDSLGLANNVTNVVKASAKNAFANVEGKTEWGKSILEKASNNGVNSAQQCVLEALWLTYDSKKLLIWTEYNEASKKVKAL